jgi:ABC-type transport system substrate-binding protein
VTIRKILIIIPILVIVFLLQSYFWVPTYEEQSQGNPDRLKEYISASIGDAAILNPILSADSASSTIEGLVFEGLIDYDENLRFRGRLATSWEIHEEAFFCVNEDAYVPKKGKIEPNGVLRLLQQARKEVGSFNPQMRSSFENIREISMVLGREYVLTQQEKAAKGTDRKREVKIRVRSPARIKLVLGNVDQFLFESLSEILGKDYFKAFNAQRYVQFDPEVDPKKKSEYAGEVLPATEHNPIIVFHLRPGVKFHDGHPFEAKDVKFTYDAIMNPKNISPRLADYEPVKEVQVIDPLTIRVVYKRLYSPALGTWQMGILPEHLLNDGVLRKEAAQSGKNPEKFSMRDSPFNRHPVGCGPFVFKEWKPDQFIKTNRYSHYWEGSPNYDQYFFRIIPDLLTQEMEFYAGTVDAYDVRPHQVARFRQDPKYQSFSGLAFGYTYIGYNQRREPFNDRRVRTALGMAIDVNKIIRYVLFGQGERITGPFPKQTDYYNAAVKPLPYDPKGALKLLEEAGWKRNKEGWLEKNGKRLQFTLITNNGNDLRKAILTVAQDGWRKIGIDVRTDLLEWAVFIQERVDKADFDALVLGWSMGIEPDLFQIWHSSQTHPFQLNFVGFKNNEADDLIVKIRREYDHERQVAYCHQLHEIIAREQPYTFLYVTKWTAVLDKRIVIQETNAEGKVVYKKITPTKTGNYMFYFNKWIKLPQVPAFAAEG